MTSLQYIVETLREGNLVQPTQVNYGIVDGLKPPYIAVMGYKQEPAYDTCGVGMRRSEFTVRSVEADADKAQVLGEGVLALLNLSTTVTPNTARCLWTLTEVGQMEQNLYQYGVDISFRLEESP